VIEDISADDNWLRIPNDNARSAIVVPLLAHRDVLGVLTLTHKKEGHFKPEQLNLLGAIASQAAIAVENAQLYAVERKRVNELVALNQLTREINQFTSSLGLIKGLPDLVNRSLGYPTVALWQEEGANLILQSISGKEDATNTSILETGPRQAILTGQPAQLSGAVNGHGEGETPAIQSVIAVPIFWDDKVNGALSIYSHRANAFKESDRVVLETLAIQYQSALERIQLFESAEQEKKRMDAVLQAAADAILLIDEDGNLQLVNLAGERLFTDVETRLMQPLPRGRGYDSLINLLEEAVKTGETSTNEIDWPDQRTFSALTTPIEDGGLVIMLHDVTHFKDMERIKNEFIATASHDLKNPIHSVMGYSDLLIKAGPLNDTQKEFVVRLQRASTQMYELVLNLLEMARMDLDPKLKLQRYDAQTLLTDIIQEFQAQAGAKRQNLISMMPKEGDHQVDVDLPRIRQVVRNLMANAVKYTPENGEITLSTSHQDSTLWVHVRDNGLGIPEEDLPHIFEKFYRVDSDDRMEIQGNGLGLAIVKAIVEEHGGEVSVESVFGEGSCFSFSLPLASNPEK
jgi:signal transduction histidine kinase